MNDIENDIDVEKELPQKLSAGNVIQLIVFLNGVILTVVVWAFLNVYIGSVLDDERNYTTGEVYQTVKENIDTLENTIKATATIISMFENKNFKSIQEQVLYAVPDIMNFDRVIWLREEGEEWHVNDFKEDDISFSSVRFFGGSEQSLVQLLQKNRNIQQGFVTIVTDLPGIDYVQENAYPLVKSRLFAIAVKVLDKDGNNGLIVGLARFTTGINYDSLINQDKIIQLNIYEKATERPIFSISRNRSGRGSNSDEIMTFKKDINSGSAEWRVEIVTGKSSQTLFLEKMPWLMLIFGIMLTSIGTLYVRNNQKQSLSLSKMNKALAQKNYELNSEVAERETLYEKMRKTDRENRAIIDAVSDIIFETSTDGEITFLNETWRSVTGFELAQGINRNIFDMLHPHDQEEQRTNFEQLVKGHRHAYRAFARLRTSNGTYRSIELAMSMLRKDRNGSIKVVGTITDVEEHRRAEKALGEAERKYREIIENTASGIYQVTPEGQFLSTNPAVALILGYDSTEELIRKVINAHEQLYVIAKERSNFIRELEAKGVISNFEIQMLKKDGTEIWVNENARSVLDDSGNLLYYEGSIEDITKRKATEIELREAKMQSDIASRAKSEFLANMSHELRTPLNTIIGFSEIIKNEILGPIEQRQYWEYANDIYESGNNLLAIISEILDISRIDAGERQLNEGIVDIDKIVKSCLGILAPRIETNNMVLKNSLDGVVPKLIGEELAIKQILMNLLSNAIKFTPHGGHITISHEFDSYGQLRISITDTGIGLDENEIEKALSPFGQIETSLDRSSYGTGLGLTLVASLMRLHSGEFELFSQKGVGTTATIIFAAKRVVHESGKMPYTKTEADHSTKKNDISGDVAEDEGEVEGDGDGTGSINIPPPSTELQ